ncbi:hypothetical protein SAMN02745866_03208 [Alteromonadaceae bacterium Bs31]|nr:hypothetical protein SAMN02745866_03208 [Alteromonadaceae bacterium Bs31]
MRSMRVTSEAHNKALKHQPSELGLDLRYGASRLHCGRLARRYAKLNYEPR